MSSDPRIRGCTTCLQCTVRVELSTNFSSDWETNSTFLSCTGFTKLVGTDHLYQMLFKKADDPKLLENTMYVLVCKIWSHKFSLGSNLKIQTIF